MIPQCRFGDGPAVVRAKMDRGCVCFPDDREQFLCAHHWYKSEPLGGAVVVEELGEPDDDEYALRNARG